MERSFRLAAILLFAAVSPAFAHTWLIDGQKVEGDFVRESHDQIRAKNGKMQPVAIVILSVRGKEHKYQLSKLSFDDKKYEQEQVKLQKTTADEVDERSWKDKNGKTAKGRLMDMDGNKVVLLIQQNDMLANIRRPFKDFSREDRDYIRKKMIALNKGDLVPPEPPPSAHPKPDGSKVVQAKTPEKPKSQTSNPPANPSPAPSPAPQEMASTSKPPETAHPEATHVEAAHPDTAHPDTAHPDTAHPPSTQPAPAQQATTKPAPAQPAPAPPAARQQATGKSSASPLAQSLLAKTPAEPKRLVGAPPSIPPPPPIKSKVCSACGKKLPDTVKAGDSCPFCGVYLQYENTDQGPPIEVSSTFRTLGAPAGLASLFCVIAVAVFRLRSYAQH